MIKLGPEEHAQAIALANRMKAEFPSVPPKIAIVAVHALQLEIVVQLSGGKKPAALAMLKSMFHDFRDSVRDYFNGVEARKAAAKEAAGKPAFEAVGAAHAIAVGTKENA